jgi:hypothetical protein
MDINNISDTTISFGEKLRNFDPLSIFSGIQKFLQFFVDLFDPNSQYAAIWSTMKIFLGAAAVFFVFVIAYCFVRLIELRKKEKEYLRLQIANYAQKHKEKEEKRKNLPKNPRWGNVLENLNQGEKGWRLAILEADMMLDSMLTQIGFSGDTLGDKLKLVDMEKYPSLKNAWEIHNVRNKIAHEGSTFEISEHEVKRIIALYERIFTDFSFI